MANRHAGSTASPKPTSSKKPDGPRASTPASQAGPKLMGRGSPDRAVLSPWLTQLCNVICREVHTLTPRARCGTHALYGPASSLSPGN